MCLLISCLCQLKLNAVSAKWNKKIKKYIFLALLTSLKNCFVEERHKYDWFKQQYIFSLADISGWLFYWILCIIVTFNKAELNNNMFSALLTSLADCFTEILRIRAAFNKNELNNNIFRPCWYLWLTVLLNTTHKSSVYQDWTEQQYIFSLADISSWVFYWILCIRAAFNKAELNNNMFLALLTSLADCFLEYYA